MKLPNSLFTKDRKETSNSGFTLVEILVSLTIIGLVFGFGFVGFREFSRRQSLQGAKRKLLGDLRLAQQQALSGKKPASIECSNPNTLNGFDFEVISQSDYRVRANCTGGNVEVKSVELTEEVSITASTPIITFKILGKGTTLPADATITLTQLGSGNTLDVLVSMGGEIK